MNQQYVCDIDGEFQVVEMTGREAHSPANPLGRLVEVIHGTDLHWIPVTDLFKIVEDSE